MANSSIWQKAKIPLYKHAIAVYGTNITGLPSQIAFRRRAEKHNVIALWRCYNRLLNNTASKTDKSDSHAPPKSPTAAGPPKNSKRNEEINYQTGHSYPACNNSCNQVHGLEQEHHINFNFQPTSSHFNFILSCFVNG